MRPPDKIRDMGADEDYWRYELWHLRQLRECCELGNNDTMEEYFVPRTDQRDDPPDADVAEPRVGPKTEALGLQAVPQLCGGKSCRTMRGYTNG
jgi:hypothetical protein